MEIVFRCGNCRKNLVVDASEQGQTVNCPVCGRPVTIPVPTAKAPALKRVIRIPSGKAKEESQPQPANTTAEPKEAAAQPPNDTHPQEIVVGWVCVVVGILLEVLLPRAALGYVPFFIGSFLMGVRLLATRRVLHGLVLLLCTCVPPFLLARHTVWDNLTGSAARAPAGSAKVQKLVFDEHGRAKLVSQEEPAPQRWDPTPRPAPVRPAALERTTTASPEAGAEHRREKPRQPRAKPAEDQYRELLENKADVPPLVPEDVLASTPLGHGDDFRWQKASITDTLLPGDPAPVVDVPFVVYSDGGLKETYAATGRLGNKGALQFDTSWDLAPHSGMTCIYVRYEDAADWVTVAWQHPGHNWGDYPGGFDLSKARKLTFWAKGESGSERVEFMVGMEQAQNAVSRDSLRASTGVIRLQKEWKKYSLSIEKLDRTRLITGFLFRIEGQGKPVVFCLDDIQFE
ncbi:MAG: hypothetical protein V1873_05720 [Verrucomicrobiota bacterium]